MNTRFMPPTSRLATAAAPIRRLCSTRHRSTARREAIRRSPPSPSRLSAIQNAVTRGDADLIESTAHALKGAAAYVSASQVVEAASRLEIMGRERRLREAAAACHTLETAVASLVAVLRATDGRAP